MAKQSEPQKDRVSRLIDELFPTELPGTNHDRLSISNIHTLPSPALRARQELFLETLEAGWSDAKARRAAGVSMAIVDMWKRDPEFLAQYNDAFKDGTGYLEDLAFVRAHTSDPVLIKLLESRDPSKYRPRAGGGSGNINVIIAPLFPGADAPEQTKITINGEVDDG